ncbi:hypothetical protein TNCV_2879461 [Trichonephila clavipes]|uniref:Uncharacterized protein n=1 Tax=Trichonephila clavipes TaxID=2585209 RepID=A0A8X6W1M5_TRICX|nr:hypothetical protein TNCV_2879461 [Trichonephila clavipes]
MDDENCASRSRFLSNAKGYLTFSIVPEIHTLREAELNTNEMEPNSISFIRCRAQSEQAPFEEEDDGKKLPRCCCPLMTAHEQSEDKIPAQKVQGFKS